MSECRGMTSQFGRAGGVWYPLLLGPRLGPVGPTPLASNQLMILLAILEGALWAPLLVYDVTSKYQVPAVSPSRL